MSIDLYRNDTINDITISYNKYIWGEMTLITEILD